MANQLKAYEATYGADDSPDTVVIVAAANFTQAARKAEERGEADGSILVNLRLADNIVI